MWKEIDEFCGEPVWDHALTWNTTVPELTPCFERTVLVWVPCAVLWALAPFELLQRPSGSPKALPWTLTLITRMVLAASLTVLSTADALDVMFNRHSSNLFAVDLTADVLKIATFIFSLILMASNRKRGRYTSAVLFVFWFCLTVCEVFPYRSSFLQVKSQGEVSDESRFVIEMIFFPLLVAQLLLSCLSDIRFVSPPFSRAEGDLKESPEQSASFLSKLIFWWFNGMAVLGWRRPLTTADLWQLNPEDRSQNVAAQFAKYWRPVQMSATNENFNNLHVDGVNEKTKESEANTLNVETKVKEKRPARIVRCLCKTFWGYFLAGSVCKAIYDILQFINPLVLKLLMDYVQSSDPLWKGIFYSFLLFGNGCLQSLLLGNYFQRMFVLGMRTRTALVSAIYNKSLLLSAAARRESTIGEIVNLMSVDSQRFMDLMTYLNLVWSAPLQIILASYFLWRILGVSVLAGLLVMVTLIPTNAFLAARIKRLQVEQMKSKDERVKLVSELLTGIKVLKLYAWEEAFQKQVLLIRNQELRHLRHIAYMNSLSILIWNCSPFLVALASFACYVLSDESHVLDATTAFVSLALFNILRFPLTMLPHLLTTMVTVAVSVRRLDTFLGASELQGYVNRSPALESEDQTVLTVTNGTFSWGPDEAPVLRNINLNVPRGSLIAVVGPVGAGKSSLISAVLGDMYKVSGNVTLNGSVALVSQQAWIQNATLKDNILFSLPFRRDCYKELLDACSLKPDLETLPGGDLTEIGEKGINLSGGQKQRVSLARAVYSDADIYFLDDPLSAVDAHVGRHIFDNVIGPKGLMKDKTRILVTHSLAYLPQVDFIVTMRDGIIAEKGSYRELIEHGGPFAEFIAQHLQESTETDEDLSIIQEEIARHNPQLLRSLSEKSSESERMSERSLSVLSVNRSPESKKDRLTQVEIAETGEVHVSIYGAYVRAVGLNWVVLILVSHIIWQAFAVGSSIWLSEWGNDPPGVNGTHNIALRDLRLGVYGGLGLAQGLAIFIGAFAIAQGTFTASKCLHSGLLDHVLRAPMQFFDTTPLGRIVNRFSKDVDTVDVTLPMTIRSWLACLLQVLATLFVIALQTPLFLAVTLPLAVMYYAVQRFYVSTSRQLKRLESISRSPVYSHFSETLAGSSTIRAYAFEERFRSQSSSLVDANQRCYYPSIVANRWLAIRLDFCGNCIILFSALFAVLGRDDLDAGRVGLSVSYALMVTATLNWMVRMSSELETNIVAVERLLEYSNTATEAAWTVEGSGAPPKDWPREGRVQFDNYCTRYREGLDLVLQNISCDIQPGEKVGIVGRTGAGKSSLALALFRIIEPSSGTIRIDDFDLSAMGLHQLRSRITVIPQDPVLFSGSLRQNLDPFNWHTDEELWAVLELAHLKSFVSSLEQGLLHEIQEGGENLSVGQRQLVCLARALLRRTRVLVLDEATAAVDLETDRLLQNTLKEAFADSTILAIAHRLHTVMDYDRIVVLDKGKIAEFDSPEALLKNKNSIFYGMAKDAGLA